MPTIKSKRVWTIECVQKIGDILYPRIFPYMTKAEQKKNFDALSLDPSFSCVVQTVGEMSFPVPTRAERRAEVAAAVEQLRVERNARRRSRREDEAHSIRLRAGHPYAGRYG